MGRGGKQPCRQRVSLFALWKEDVRQRPESALWLLNPVLRPQWGLGTLGVRCELLSSEDGVLFLKREFVPL